MHAKDSSARKERNDVDADSRHVAIVVCDQLRRERRPRRRTARVAGVADQLGNHALAGRADQYRVAERYDAAQLDESGKRGTRTLRKADPRIERYPARMDAGPLRALHALLQLSDHFSDRIPTIHGLVVTRHLGDGAT